MRDTLKDIIADRVKLEREIKGMTYKSLCAESGISSSMLCRIEQAENLPALRTLIAIADAMDVSLDYLCGRQG